MVLLSPDIDPRQIAKLTLVTDISVDINVLTVSLKWKNKTAMDTYSSSTIFVVLHL